MDETRALLDSLMGKDRNHLKPQKKTSFTDNDVCKYYLLNFCPHDLFPNTKSDLGPCEGWHSDVLKDAFEADENNEYYRALYEGEYMRFLKRLVDQVEQKIVKGQQRLNVPSPANPETEKRISILSEEMSALLKKAEDAGAEGKIDEASILSDRALKLRADIDNLRGSSQEEHQRDSLLRICQVCGAIQSVGDSASRFESHITGKQHVGFERIRTVLSELKANESHREATLRKTKPSKNTSLSAEREKEPSKHTTKNGLHRDNSRERHRNIDRRDRTSSPRRDRHLSHKSSKHYRSRNRYSSLERGNERHSYRKHGRNEDEYDYARDRNGYSRSHRHRSRSSDRYERSRHC